MWSKIFHPILLKSMDMGYLQWSTLFSATFASVFFIQCVVIRKYFDTDNMVHPASILILVHVIGVSYFAHLMLIVKTNILVYNLFENTQN